MCISLQEGPGCIKLYKDLKNEWLFYHEEFGGPVCLGGAATHDIVFHEITPSVKNYNNKTKLPTENLHTLDSVHQIRCKTSKRFIFFLYEILSLKWLYYV